MEPIAAIKNHSAAAAAAKNPLRPSRPLRFNLFWCGAITKKLQRGKRFRAASA
jgi:hypothetical protein